MDKTARLNWLAALLLAACVTALGILAGRALSSKPGASLNTAIQLPCTGEKKIEILGDGVAYSDGSTLHALGSGGSQIWSCAVGVDMDFSVSDGGVAAWSQDKLYLLGAGNGSLYYSGSLGTDILSAKLGDTYAAVLTGEENDATLLVLEKGGRQVDSISVAPEIVMDYGFFNGGSILWVMTLNTEGTTPLSTISTYRPGRTMAGSVTDSQQTVYRVFFQSQNICAVGTTYGRFYDYNGNELEDRRQLVYGWYLTAVGGSEESPLMAFAPIDQTNVSMRISDVRLIRGSSDRVVRMPFPCTALCARGSTVYGVSGRYVITLDAEDPMPVARELPVEADRLVGVTGNRSLVVVSGGQVFMIGLD